MSRRLFLVLFSVFVFLLPLKFGNPIVLESLTAVPHGFMDWFVSGWPNQIALLAAFLLLAAGVWVNEGRATSSPRAFWLPCAFLITQLTSNLMSVTPQVSLDTTVMFAAGLAVYWTALSHLKEDADSRFPRTALLASTVIICWVTIDQYYGGLQSTRDFFHEHYKDADVPPDYLIKINSDRPFGTFVYSNSLAGYLVLVGPVLIGSLWQFRHRWEPAALWVVISVMGGLVLFSLVLSGSKGGFLSLAGVVVVAVWVVRMPHKIKWLLIGLLILCGIGLFARYGTRLFSYGLGTSAARMDYWKAGLRIFADHPVLGTGPGTYGSVYPKYKLFTAEDPRLAHNNFLETLSDSGVLGFLTYAALWLWPLVVGIRRCRQSSDPLLVGLTLSLVGWVLHGLVDFDLYIPSLALLAFLFLGMLEGKLLASAKTEAPSFGQSLAVTVVALFLCILPIVRLAASRHFDEGRQLARENPYAAVKLMDQAIHLAPLDAWYNSEAAKVQIRLGRPDGMLRLMRARALDPYRSVYAWDVAKLTKQNQGLSSAYFLAAENAIALAPKNPEYRQVLAQDYTSSRQTENASRHWAAYQEIQKAALARNADPFSP